MIDANFIRVLEDAAPLHDIGKAALPDHILNKPGPLDTEGQLLMQTHTTTGADTLREVARRHPFSTGFLHMAIDIAQHHHERWDGTGYPDRLGGEQIPLAARVVAIADVYDALRLPLMYKPGLSHHTAVLTITEELAQPADLALARRVPPPRAIRPHLPRTRRVTAKRGTHSFTSISLIFDRFTLVRAL